MPNGVKYMLMAMLFMALTKVLQVTAFDSKHYEKLQKASESRSYLQSSKSVKESESLGRKQSKSDVVNEPKEPKAAKSEVSGETRATDLVDEPESTVTLSSLKNGYLAPLLAQIPSDQLREDIVIRYYRHGKDLAKVDRLRALSYYIHEKQAVETAGLGSNAIYYGDDVPLEDIQIIAFTLLEAGIPLKSIKHTKFTWKARAIEIGTDTSLVDSATLSIEEIQNFHKQYISAK